MMDDAARFHGHLGPFLILGLKAGLFANEVFGKGPFRTRAIVETSPVPPCSCAVDGIQIAAGCTMGKGNIELKKGPSLTVTFQNGEKKVELALKSEIFERLKAVASEEDIEMETLNLSREPIRSLFDIKE